MGLNDEQKSSWNRPDIERTVKPSSQEMTTMGHLSVSKKRLLVFAANRFSVILTV